MALKTHHRLFLSYSLLVAAVVVILIVGVDATLRAPMLAQAEADLMRELALGRELHMRSPDADPDALARRMAEVTGHRVTIIAGDGRVLGESDVSPDQVAELDDHSERPEVSEALTTGSGTAVRWSASVGAELLYAAALAEGGSVIRFAVGIEQIGEAVAAVRRQILIVGVVALLLAALFSLGFSFLITRPLRRMHRTAIAMAGGDLGARVRPARNDELGDLGRALDQLAAELERRLGQLEGERAEMTALIDSMVEGVIALEPDGTLRRANPAARSIFGLPDDARGMPPEVIARRKAFLDIVEHVLAGEAVPPTELTHDGRHLLATAQPLPRGRGVLVFLDTTELRRLEGMRRDFVANASHELKTPLTVIRGNTETLLQEDLPADLRRRFTETLHNNVTRLQRIVDDLLDLSQIESGGWKIEPEELVVADIARSAWQSFADVAERRGLSFVVESEPGADTVVADRAALLQVFANLFSNAIRYTSEGGQISVTVRRAEAEIVVDVRDNGSGIPAEHVGRIFERFYRVDPARSRAEGGTGLGLAIVRHLIERHGGRVEAESAVGEWTTIRLFLPEVVEVS